MKTLVFITFLLICIFSLHNYVQCQVLIKSPVTSSDDKSNSSNVYSVREGFQQNIKSGKSTTIKSQATVNIFPNPTSAFTSVSVEDINNDYKIVISDIIGNKVKEFSATNPNQFNIDCRDWATGVYLVSLIVDRNALIVKKLVISK